MQCPSGIVRVIMSNTYVKIDGNEAAAYVAHRTNEVVAIYPITPVSPMGELADLWTTLKQPNIWGTVPEIIEMQSEGGAAIFGDHSDVHSRAGDGVGHALRFVRPGGDGLRAHLPCSDARGANTLSAHLSCS